MLICAYKPGENIYSILWNLLTGYVWDAGDAAWEAPGSWDVDRRRECDVALPEKGGGFYMANLPTGITNADDWVAIHYLRGGASPEETDRIIGVQKSTELFIKSILEGDTYIDKDPIPWQIVIKIKGTSTELIRKNLKDIDGNNIGNIRTIIGKEEEP